MGFYLSIKFWKRQHPTFTLQICVSPFELWLKWSIHDGSTWGFLNASLKQDAFYTWSGFLCLYSKAHSPADSLKTEYGRRDPSPADPCCSLAFEKLQAGWQPGLYYTVSMSLLFNWFLAFNIVKYRYTGITFNTTLCMLELSLNVAGHIHP